MVFNALSGIVIKEMTKPGETGKRIRKVITREHAGKCSLSARQVKKCKERNNGGNSAFSYCEFTVSRGKVLFRNAG